MYATLCSKFAYSTLLSPPPPHPIYPFIYIATHLPIRSIPLFSSLQRICSVVSLMPPVLWPPVDVRRLEFLDFLHISQKRLAFKMRK